ncbi:MAG TPA: HAD family hydrolase [Verrucomicrobiae bacterium]|jgi:D-glycero-D-manno-heptose 1,7-bisphosphate phosphatase|nr:HAD family hydrolase [Verrucomicrobiae bacterium]
MARAVFLDRDGVLIVDADLLTDPAHIQPLPGVAAALRRLQAAGFRLIVVSNQPVVARGLATEREVEAIHQEIQRQIVRDGGPTLDAFYFCPHHPRATLEEYRRDCECRKPRAGLLRQGAAAFGIDLKSSFMVGDRITDIAAGAAVGCRTVMVETGKHLLPPIHTSEPLDPGLKPDWTCADLPAAADWILAQ